jgi:hypothetical protein
MIEKLKTHIYVDLNYSQTKWNNSIWKCIFWMYLFFVFYLLQWWNAKPTACEVRSPMKTAHQWRLRSRWWRPSADDQEDNRWLPGFIEECSCLPGGWENALQSDGSTTDVIMATIFLFCFDRKLKQILHM